MWTWNADPFGTDAANPNPSGAGPFAYNLRFPGQVFDGEAGLQYNYFRDFDPATGRYIESDPIGLNGGMNTYAYAAGNSINSVDNSGLATCTLAFVNGAAAIHCEPDDPGHTPVTLPVASGNNGGGEQCKNNPSCQWKQNKGPIPLGCWKWTNTPTTKPNGRALEPCKGSSDKGRKLIRSHSCANPFGPSTGPRFCSEGCVTGLPSDIQRLNDLIDSEPDSTLYVVTPPAVIVPFARDLPGYTPAAPGLR